MIVLSIVSISKNNIKGIKSTIASLEKISGSKSVEHVIVDASEHDISRDLREYSRKASNTKYQKQNSIGISNAFNEGVKFSHGEWVWFLNGGDTMSSDIQSEFLLNYLRTAKADVVVFDYYHGKKIIHKPAFYLLWPSFYNWIPHPATIVRRSILERYGQFDPGYKIAMDGDLWMRIFSNPKINIDLVSIALSHFDSKGISSTNSQRKHREVLSINLKYLPVLTRRTLNKMFLFFRSVLESIRRSVFTT